MIMPMTVQTHYPSNDILQTRDEVELNQDEQSHVIFSSDEGNVNLKMRGKEPMPSLVQKHKMFLSLNSPAMFDFSPIQSQKPQNVSTGLQLALIKQNNNNNETDQSDSFTSPYISDDLAAQIEKEKEEIDQYFFTHRDCLRRAFADRHFQNYRNLMQTIGKKILEKDEEIRRAAICISDLEKRLSQLQTESIAWQAKAMAEQAAAISLQNQLEKVLARAVAPPGEEYSGESPAEDCESVCVDPNRSVNPVRLCRSCFRRPALVVLLPCCHLCLCVSCDFASAVGHGCPACGCFRTGSIQVSFG